jgi:hypothetical protein
MLPPSRPNGSESIATCTGRAVLAALERRFGRLRFDWVPYIAWMLRQPDREPDEARAITAGTLAPVGFRWIGCPLLGVALMPG